MDKLLRFGIARVRCTHYLQSDIEPVLVPKSGKGFDKRNQPFVRILPSDIKDNGPQAMNRTVGGPKSRVNSVVDYVDPVPRCPKQAHKLPSGCVTDRQDSIGPACRKSKSRSIERHKPTLE